MTTGERVILRSVADSDDRQVVRLPDNADALNIAFSPDGAHLLLGTDSGAVSYELESSGSKLRVGELTHQHAAGDRRVVFPVPETSLALLEPVNDTSIELWNWRTGELAWRLDALPHELVLAGSPDGTRFAMITGDVVKQYFVDVDDLLDDIASWTEPLSPTDCLATMGRADC